MLYKVRMNITCADPGIFVRGWGGGGGGGGGPGQSDKKALTTLCFFLFCFFVFFFVFFVLSLFFRSQMVNFKENYHFSRFQGGSTFFQGGGGSNCLFPIETHITCDFPGGVRTPCPPPLDPHLYNNNLNNRSSFY